MTVTLVNYGVSPDGIYGSGLVTGVVESGGTCTLTARNGSTTASQSMAATSSPSATNCGRITVPVTAGDWTVVLSYSSSTSEGASDPVPVHTS